MNQLFTFLILFTVNFALYGQEICNNAIDDDGDSFIDLNDDECDCEGFGEVIESLIPNPSFEERTCCPIGISELHCAIDWNQASDGTSDYFNTCGDFIFLGGCVPPMFPLPGAPGGEGFTGFLVEGSIPMFGLEYIGTEDLLTPLLSGTAYTLKLFTAYGLGNLDLEFSIYGTPDVTDLPWDGYECPLGVGSWELLTSEPVIYTLDGAWHELTLTFTPSVDIYAIALGGSCDKDGPLSYYYLDELTLNTSDVFSDIFETGSLCYGDLMLNASTDTSGGTWQWYKDGIALLGETGTSVDVDVYGYGDYSAVYTIGEICQELNHSVMDPVVITADFDFTSHCAGEELDFTNSSFYGGGLEPTWLWDFGDGGTSTVENPSHTYVTAGSYLVELIAFNHAGCNDTIEIEVTIDLTPTADFEFVVGDFSSEDGLTEVCPESTILFNDLSTIADPGIITSWSWDFGDGGSSALENPTHDYASTGAYIIILTVEAENGCSSAYGLIIAVTEGLGLELITSEPTCYGYTDGSITVNVIGGGDELLFTIADADGNVLNEDNSNTVNELSSGWYFIEVNDSSECGGRDSIFLDQPGQLAVDLTVYDVLCNGLETGWAIVDSVFNFTGDYNQINYFWNPNPAGVNGLGADSIWGVVAGNYALTVTDENGCSDTVNFEIIKSPPLFVSVDTRPALCRTFGYQNGNGVVFGDVTGGVPDYTYLWTNLTTGETTPNTTWGGRNPGNYQFTVTDAYGCVINSIVFLDSINPQAIFSVNSAQLNTDNQGTAPVEVEFVNESINFAHADDPLSDTTFFWNLDHPAASWYLTHNYFEIIDSTYLARGQSYQVDVCLIALNKNNCSDTACKILTIYEPIKFSDVNIFSPNGDGINDVFTFEFKAASIAEFECVIVNRWGVLITELTSITDGWDGTNKNGVLVEDGVYFYSYKARTDNNTLLVGQGNIQVIGGN